MDPDTQTTTAEPGTAAVATDATAPVAPAAPEVTSAPVTATPPESGGERTFTQTEVNAMIAQRLARRDRQAAPAPEPAPNPEAKPKPAADPAPAAAFDMEAVVAQVTANTDRKYAIRELNLNADQAVAIELMYQEQAPIGDAGDWVRAKAASMGFVQATGAPTVPTPDPATPPASDGGAPSPAPIATVDSNNPLSWSRDYINKVYGDMGPVKGRKFLRQKFEESMGSTTVSLKRR